jgi:glycosyltransferase involved in cell wall biosynthesis
MFLFKIFFFIIIFIIIKGYKKFFYLYNRCINKHFFYYQNYCNLYNEYYYGVSVCITAFKSVKFIKKTLNTIINQTWFKKNDNYEIILGIDGCNETLQYIKNIKNNYKNLIVIMMKENKGTYITTNTIMTISKYDHLIRFDSDDIMYPNLVEKVMTQSTKYDMVRFKMKNYNIMTKKTNVEEAIGQFMMKHWVFDYFGGFMPWKCGSDAEFKKRIIKFIKVIYLKDVLLLRQIHPQSLTQSKETNFSSKERKNKFIYIKKKTKKIKNLKQARIDKVIFDFYEIN